MAFLDDYESVADRIDRFWKEHPTGSIITDLVHHDEKRFIVKATVWNARALDPEKWHDLPPSATGYAEEIVGSTNVNKTSALENCETSAIGRALANLGFAAKGQRPSREEMAKAQPEPRQRSGMKRTPTPSESHEDAPRTNGTATGVNVGQMRSDLLAAVKGDAAKSNMIWRETLAQFGFQPADQVPDDMWAPIGEALKARVTA